MLALHGRPRRAPAQHRASARASGLPCRHQHARSWGFRPAACAAAAAVSVKRLPSARSTAPEQLQPRERQGGRPDLWLSASKKAALLICLRRCRGAPWPAPDGLWASVKQTLQPNPYTRSQTRLPQLRSSPHHAAGPCSLCGSKRAGFARGTVCCDTVSHPPRCIPGRCSTDTPSGWAGVPSSHVTRVARGGECCDVLEHTVGCLVVCLLSAAGAGAALSQATLTLLSRPQDADDMGPAPCQQAGLLCRDAHKHVPHCAVA